jgi:hypothetical protein
MADMSALDIAEPIRLDQLDGAIDVIGFDWMIATEHDAVDPKRIDGAAKLRLRPARRSCVV